MKLTQSSEDKFVKSNLHKHDERRYRKVSHFEIYHLM